MNGTVLLARRTAAPPVWTSPVITWLGSAPMAAWRDGKDSFVLIVSVGMSIKVRTTVCCRIFKKYYRSAAKTDWLIDWLMITYIGLFSALLSRLSALACGSTWVTTFNSAFFEYPPKWCTYSAGMAGATWNCSHLGASSVYTIQPCTMSLHAKPHT